MSDFKTDEYGFLSFDPDKDYDLQKTLSEFEEFFSKDRKNSNVDNRSLHEGHTIIKNHAMGKPFFVCKECKKEVI